MIVLAIVVVVALLVWAGIGALRFAVYRVVDRVV